MVYLLGVSSVLGLNIPLEAAANRSEVQQFQERQQKRQKLKEEGGGGDAAAEAALPKVRWRRRRLRWRGAAGPWGGVHGWCGSSDAR